MQKSEFSEKVGKIVRRIPKGKTLSYKEVAVKAGNPLAARAVARVMSSNFDPSVPCHRVICANGGLGGYNIEARKRETLSPELIDILEEISYTLNSPCKGIEIKQKILLSEGVIFK